MIYSLHDVAPSTVLSRTGIISLALTYEAIPSHYFASSMVGYIDEIDVTLHLHHKELLSELILCEHDTNAATLTSGLAH